MNHSVILLITLLFFILNGSAQDVGGKTLVSQPRTTSTNIGNCDITVSYHSPSVNGRKVFGGIVPFDFVVDGKEYPWRAGANQRTTIEFSHDVEIEGKKLSAGSYGFVALVSEKEWTLIFSSGKSWGAFNYEKTNDVLRIEATPQKSSFQEWLSYEFTNPGPESVDIQLKWEEIAIKFSVVTDAIANKIFDLRNLEEKTAADYQSLAIRTLEKSPDQKEKALDYLEFSKTKIEEYEEEAYKKAYTFNYKVLKGELLIEMGKKKEGQGIILEALENAEGFSIYYYALNKLLVKGKSKEALRLLEDQIKKDPKNRANYFALGEYYLKLKDQEQATESFKKAYELAKGTRGENYAKYLYHQNRLILESGLE